MTKKDLIFLSQIGFYKLCSSRTRVHKVYYRVNLLQYCFNFVHCQDPQKECDLYKSGWYLKDRGFSQNI